MCTICLISTLVGVNLSISHPRASSILPIGSTHLYNVENHFLFIKVGKSNLKNLGYFRKDWGLILYTWHTLKLISKFLKLLTFSNLLTLHSDLYDPILPKKSPLSQNGLQLNKKCLKIIFRYFSSPFLPQFKI
jgi:hypothetical protein